MIVSLRSLLSWTIRFLLDRTLFVYPVVQFCQQLITGSGFSSEKVLPSQKTTKQVVIATYPRCTQSLLEESNVG